MKENTIPTKPEAKAPETRDEARTLAPLVDIFELPDGLAVVADLPGVAKEDVDVHVQEGLLTISGKIPAGDAPTAVLGREYELRNYFRQFQLSEQIDQERIKADMKYGVLTIHLPKAEKAKPKRIAVDVKS